MIKKNFWGKGEEEEKKVDFFKKQKTPALYFFSKQFPRHLI